MTTATTPRRAWLRAALIGSLALNVFLGAVLVAGWARHHGPGWRGGPPEMMTLLRHVGGAEARAVRAAHRDALRGRIDAVRAARAAAAEALAAQPFDPVAFQAALGQIGRASSDAQAAFHDAFAEIAVTLTPEERHDLAQRLARRRLGPGG